jgi:hypothetical protein
MSPLMRDWAGAALLFLAYAACLGCALLAELPMWWTNLLSLLGTFMGMEIGGLIGRREARRRKS